MLVNYLEIEFNPIHKFLPVDFFEVLNRSIPEKFTARPKYRDVLVVASKRRKIEEEDKIYFCGWRRNPVGKNVSEKNLEKTRSAFGDVKAEMCERKNISSFMFELTKEEFENLMSKKSTSSWGGRRKLPKVFTEQGIYMLMTVLRGELAIKQSKALVRTFKKMKDYIIDNRDLIGQL